MTLGLTPAAASPPIRRSALGLVDSALRFLLLAAVPISAVVFVTLSF